MCVDRASLAIAFNDIALTALVMISRSDVVCANRKKERRANRKKELRKAKKRQAMSYFSKLAPKIKCTFSNLSSRVTERDARRMDLQCPLFSTAPSGIDTRPRLGSLFSHRLSSLCFQRRVVESVVGNVSTRSVRR